MFSPICFTNFSTNFPQFEQLIFGPKQFSDFFLVHLLVALLSPLLHYPDMKQLRQRVKKKDDCDDDEDEDDVDDDDFDFETGV